MSRDLAGKHIWLVGASTGIGRALAVELDRRGARLILSARSADKLASLAGELDNDARVLPLDVSDREAIEQAVSEIDQLDGVVYLAAPYNPQQWQKRIEPGLIDQMVTVNLTGAIHLVQAVRERLVSRDGSFLVLYASIAGYRGLPNGQPYSATKAGLINYAESLRAELAGQVDVKVINSGFVDTRMTRKNTFKMPMLMEPPDAARVIANGLQKNGYEIYFPFRFAMVAKLLRVLPNWLFFAISKQFR